MTRHRLTLLCPLFVVLTACCHSACRSHAPDRRPPAGASMDPLPDSEYPTIVLHDGLDADLVRGEVRVERSASGHIRRVVALIRSWSDTPLYVEYRVTYRDSDGAELNAVSRWHPIMLLPRSRKSITDVAVESGADSFVVEIRRDPS